MPDFKSIANVSEIPKRSGKAFEIDGKAIAIFNVDGTFYAMDNTCAHRGGPLGEGTLEGTTVTCPWHQWEYNVTTGKTLMDPDVGVDRYEVKVEGDQILVAL